MSGIAMYGKEVQEAEVRAAGHTGCGPIPCARSSDFDNQQKQSNHGLTTTLREWR